MTTMNDLNPTLLRLGWHPEADPEHIEIRMSELADTLKTRDLPYGLLEVGAVTVPSFVLVATDVFAPYAVQQWATLARSYASGLQAAGYIDADGVKPDQLRAKAQGADEIAARMIHWQAENSVKIPD